jgi:2-oxoglutarate dehydrogenase E2 component (dihydrolipoamide succinyltransferase)
VNETPPANVNGKINRFYSPLVMNIASSEGISMTELENIPGSGNEGRVTKKDILNYVANRGSYETNKAAAAPVTDIEPVRENVVVKQEAVPATNGIQSVEKPTEATAGYGDNVEVVEMDRMRKLIAKHMVNSKQTSPHVTSFTEADVTNMVLWREKNKKEFEKQNNTKITFTPIFIDCLVRVMKRYPMINSSVDGDKIIIKRDLNIGMATALPSGNLIVPVIKNADELNLVGLSKRVNNLADAARNNKLKPDDTLGGTFTLTNVGTFGSLMGTPIINQPQVAILAVGAIKKRPVVIETEQGDTIGIRHIMYLSLSYDHRIVDGSLGASFLRDVAKEFENWDLNKAW